MRRKWSSIAITHQLLLLPLLLLIVIVVLFPGMTWWQVSDWAKVTRTWNVRERLFGSTKKSSRIARQLVLGRAAGQGLPGRVQCDEGQSLQAATRTPPVPVQCRLPEDEMVTFVTMFVSGRLQQGGVPEKKRGDGGGAAVDKRLTVLNVFLQSVEVSMPASDTVVIADPRSDFGTGSLPRNTIVKYIYGNYSRKNLMLQRLASYIAFLNLRLDQQREETAINHVVFMDSDIILVDDLSCAFAKYPGWHVALTFRNNKNQPINSGVLMVRGTPEGLARGKAFLTRVLRVYKAKFSENARMLGDQLAFAWVLKNWSNVRMDRFKQPKAFKANVLDTDVLFLPCLLYNWTPAEGAGQFHGMPHDVKVLHFKGSTKRLMLEAWDFYRNSLSPDISSMKCLVLKSGRTKYEF